MTTEAPPVTLADKLAADAEYQAALKKIEEAASAWLSVKQTAVYLHRCVRQVRRYERDGIMPPRRKAGRKFLYPRTEIEKMKESLGKRPAAN